MSRFVCGVLAVAAVLLMAGCISRPYSDEGLYPRYYATTLGLTTSADVLTYIQNKDTELLSQSESVVVSFGSKAKDRTHWFNMVAFDQDSAAAVRKYGFICEETYRAMNQTPRPAVRLDAELILDEQTLNEPYASTNAKQIAVLQKSLKLFTNDTMDVTHDSTNLRNSTIMAQQLIKSALAKLNQSPAEAAWLSRVEGMKFDHISLGQSAIRMLIDGQKVKVKIKSGKYWLDKPFESYPDVKNM